VLVPQAGGPILTGPSAWLRALRYGTRTQRLRAIPFALVIVLAVVGFAYLVVGGERILLSLAIGVPIMALAVVSWRSNSR
jgi:hypothetical protein